MERNYRKRMGKFIPHDDRLISRVHVKEFRLTDVCDVAVVARDNPNQNLIYRNMHLESELVGVIKRHQTMDVDMRDRESLVPLLKPIDFTAEWRMMKEKRKKRVDQFEDDTESFYSREESYEEKLGLTKKEDKAVEVATEKMIGLGTNDKPFRVVSDIPAEDPSQVDNESESFVAEELIKIDSMPVNQVYEDHPAITQSFDMPTQELPHPGEDLNVGNEDMIADLKRAFSREITEKEQEIQTLDEKLRSLIEANNNLKDSITNLLRQVDDYKKETFSAVHKSSVEVVKALCEAIIKKEMSLDPHLFVKVIEDALPSQKAASAKVYISNEDFSLIAEIMTDELRSMLQPDAKMERGNFRIVAGDHQVDGSVSEMIKRLVDQVYEESSSHEDALEKVS